MKTTQCESKNISFETHATFNHPWGKSFTIKRPETWQQVKWYLWGTGRRSDTSTNQRDEVKRDAPRDQQSRHLHKRGVIYKNEHQSLSCVGKPVCIVMSEWCLTSAGKPHWHWQSSHWNWQCVLGHKNAWGCRADSPGSSTLSPAQISLDKALLLYVYHTAFWYNFRNTESISSLHFWQASSYVFHSHESKQITTFNVLIQGSFVRDPLPKI